MSVVDAFHVAYYEAVTWRDTWWLGVPVAKCPLDLWLYQELLVELRPDLVIETGTFFGGSAHFMACVCELIGHGEVVTVDIRPRKGQPRHPRLEYYIGSSTAPYTVERVRRRAEGLERVMVVLDSWHARDHVLRELDAYAPLVTDGSLLIVEDTNLNGHPVRPDYGPGPMEAVREFLAGHPEFQVDPRGDKHLMTFHPGGWLRRVSGSLQGRPS
jgi:cephalosporin hydroxylase